jgi:dihydrofolate reductase
MRKLFASEVISVDGYFTSVQGEIDWQIIDEQFTAYSVEMLADADALLFGHTTYDLMRDYWPDAAGEGNDREIATRMNTYPKYVVANRTPDLSWTSSQHLTGDLAEAVIALKQQPGKDIAILGSGSIVAQLTASRLIDEYRLILTPTVLGAGRTLFEGVGSRPVLDLVEVRPFDSGNLLLRYRPRT